MNPDQNVCTCKNGPVRTTFDPACPFHGDNGSMVATLRCTRDATQVGREWRKRRDEAWERAEEPS